MSPKNVYVVQRATHTGWIDVEVFTQSIDHVVSAKKRAKNALRVLEQSFRDHTYRVVVYEQP